MQTVYDVSSFRGSTGANEDVGVVINEIIDEVKRTQSTQDNKPGAVIYVPPGNWPLRTPVVVDISYITIKGSGHGFTSSSIRYNSGDTTGWHEVWPGGSRIVVDTEGAAFVVRRSGAPRVSAVRFEDFCLDGVSFQGSQNSYENGRTGIRFESDNDSVVIRGMGFVYLETAVSVQGADALTIDGSFIAEVGSAVMLTGAGQASKVTNNLIGAGHVGMSVFAENHSGLLVSANNIFPRGRSAVHLKHCERCSISANRIDATFPGAIVFEGGGREHLVSSNHFFRHRESWPPMQGYDNGKDDLFGIVHITGDGHTVTANHFSYDVEPQEISPVGVKPTMILVASGRNTMIAANHVVAACAVNAVVVDASAHGTIVTDSAKADQVEFYAEDVAFRALP
nr:right-handed parallel beta-helix repeat-containing protein [Actinomyces sp.]